jgi:arsenite-transporting ATPase
MPPRTILYTGKGGVGKTSVAAATARRCAAAGLRTTVLSTDPAHSLSDVLGEPLSSVPTPVAPNLRAYEVSAQDELERHWGTVREWLGGVLVARGVDRVSAEELTVPPGLDELFSLLAIQRHWTEDDADVVIVDCAPTGETLRLLSFPDVARWWLERVFPQQSRIMDAARPFARAVLDLSLPGEDVLDEVHALVRNLIALNEILGDHEHTSVRLVMTPDGVVVDESRRTFTYLNLYGYLTDAVVVNRVFPDDVGAYFDGWRARQAEQVASVRETFAPVPVLRAPFFEREVAGAEMLDRLGAAVFDGDDEHDPAGILHRGLTQELTVTRSGARLRLDLPFATAEDVTLKKIGLELVVRVGEHKRTLALPPALADYRPSGATVRDGALHVAFDRDPTPVPDA